MAAGEFAESGADLQLEGIRKTFPGFTAIEELDLLIGFRFGDIVDQLRTFLEEGERSVQLASEFGVDLTAREDV